MIKNKRGDIPITILVIGILLVCILTLASFYISALLFKKTFDFDLIKSAKLIKEKMSIYSTFGINQDYLEKNSYEAQFYDFSIKTDNIGKYIYLAYKNDDTMSVKYYLP